MANSIVSTVHQHLVSIKDNPSLPLDDFLLRKVDDYTAESLSDKERTDLLGAAQGLITVLQHDIIPVTDLIVRLIQPNNIKFDQIDALLTQTGSNDHYLQGLTSLHREINLVTLQVLSKAAASASEISLVANKVEVVREWIRLWLTAPDTAVATKAGDVLESFLLAGVDKGQATVDNNLMVRRIFRDRDIYESLFSLCSFRSLGLPDQPDRNQKTIAQSRLLDFLVKVDHSESPIRLSQLPEVEQRYDVTGRDNGLLYFGFIKMTDCSNDDMMLSIFIQSCRHYLVHNCPREHARSKAALTFLHANGLHSTCLSYFLDPRPEHGSWLLGDAVDYFQGYCSVWEDDLMEDRDLCIRVLETLDQRFKNATKADWHSAQTLNLDLLALGALPRSLHLLKIHTFDYGPLWRLPTDIPNARVVSLLADVFCGTHDTAHSIGQVAGAGRQTGRMIARVLYLLYYTSHPSLWTDVVKLADAVALTAPALAAIRFLDSFVDAEWALVDRELMPNLPSEAELIPPHEGASHPIFGIEVMLFQHGVAKTVLPYLFSPPKTFSRQDPPALDGSEDPVKTVARAKLQLTAHILQRLERMEATPDIKTITETFQKLVANNAAKAHGHVQDAGQSVATMRR